ncbi:MAG: rubrerythrin [Lachnospirales bacterium]
MKSLEGSKTAENLLKAYAGESQARNKYEFFADIAKQEGYIQVYDFFKKTADNEKIHGKIFFNHLINGFSGSLPKTITITADYTVGKGTTVQNLKESAQAEEKESKELYPLFAQIAKEEGYPEVATSFELISTIESSHQQRFLKFAENIEQNQVFEKKESVFWVCTNCGFNHTGPNALDPCPVCSVPKDYAKVYILNY